MTHFRLSGAGTCGDTGCSCDMSLENGFQTGVAADRGCRSFRFVVPELIIPPHIREISGMMARSAI
jgi:hypothetical protein